VARDRDEDFTDEPRRGRRRDDDDFTDEPRSRRRRDDDDFDDLRRPQQLTGLDALFVNTSFPLLVLFPMCCGVPALVLGILGIAMCKDERARGRAKMVVIIFVIVHVLAFFVGLIHAILEAEGGL
jgi:hypothetical protein